MDLEKCVVCLEEAVIKALSCDEDVLSLCGPSVRVSDNLQVTDDVFETVNLFELRQLMENELDIDHKLSCAFDTQKCFFCFLFHSRTYLNVHSYSI